MNIYINDQAAFDAAGKQHTKTLVDDVPHFSNVMPIAFPTSDLRRRLKAGVNAPALFGRGRGLRHRRQVLGGELDIRACPTLRLRRKRPPGMRSPSGPEGAG